MAVQDSSGIDRIIPEAGETLLIIEDDLGWQEEYAHLLTLQSKVNRCIDFAENGEMFREYPGSEALPVVVRVRFSEEPGETCKEFFRVANEVLEKSRIRLEYEKKPSL